MHWMSVKMTSFVRKEDKIKNDEDIYHTNDIYKTVITSRLTTTSC